MGPELIHFLQFTRITLFDGLFDSWFIMGVLPHCQNPSQAAAFRNVGDTWAGIDEVGLQSFPSKYVPRMSRVFRGMNKSSWFVCLAAYQRQRNHE